MVLREGAGQRLPLFPNPARSSLNFQVKPETGLIRDIARTSAADRRVVR